MNKLAAYCRHCKKLVFKTNCIPGLVQVPDIEVKCPNPDCQKLLTLMNGYEIRGLEDLSTFDAEKVIDELGKV